VKIRKGYDAGDRNFILVDWPHPSLFIFLFSRLPTTQFCSTAVPALLAFLL
jgi:hypothetical protein